MQLETIGHIRDPESIAKSIRVDVCTTFNSQIVVVGAMNTKSYPSNTTSASGTRTGADARAPGGSRARRRPVGGETLARGRQSP